MSNYYSMVEVGAAKAILKDIAVRGYDIFPEEWARWAAGVIRWFTTYLNICRKVKGAIGSWNAAVSRVWRAIRSFEINIS